MLMRRLILLTLLALAAVGAGAAPALAAPNAVLSDCNTNGALTHHYSRADLQAALNVMPADVKEYTNCYDVISRALLASAGGTSHGRGASGTGGAVGAGSTGRGPKSGTGAPGAAGTHKAIKHRVKATTGASTATPVGSANAQPAAGGVNTGSGSSSLPTPLIVLLVLLALAALSGGGLAIRRRVVARDGT